MKINNKGQALVEYLLIIVVIIIIVIILVSLLGGYAKDAITKHSCSIFGEIYEDGKKPGQGKCAPEIEISK